MPVLFRRVAFGILMLASVAVLALAVYLFWNARPWDYLLTVRPSSNLDARSQILSDRIDIYTGQVEDLGKIVAVLMVLSGIYVIAFSVSTHFYAERSQRLCEHALDTVREEFAQTAGDLREIREDARRAVERAAVDSGRVEELSRGAQHAPVAVASNAAAPQPPSLNISALELLRARFNRALSEPGAALLEIPECEHALAAMSVSAGPEHSGTLAVLYRDLALHYAGREPARARFYRLRANALIPGVAPEPQRDEAAEPPLQSDQDALESARAKYKSAVVAIRSSRFDGVEELLSGALELSAGDRVLNAAIEYELGCVLARRGSEAFEPAMQHLTRAFQAGTRILDQRISRDIDEGGALYQLAAQPPYDRQINDLLLNVSVT